MDVIRIIVDVHVPDIDQARAFYTDFLGLTVEEFDLGWVARYRASEPNGRDQTARVQLVTDDAAAPTVPIASVLTPDVDSAYAEARSRGYEIVHPLTTEAWGTRRFFVRAPDGNVFNVVGHDW
jgi:catechol 2,3-dioxygenase-like lactoylglutathione lyase family enzyme